MKKLWTKCIATVLTSAVLLSGCSSSSVTNQITSEQNQISASSVDTIINKAEIYKEKTVRVNIDKASLYGDTIDVSSSFAHLTAKTSELAKGSEPIVINELSPQLITLSGQNSVKTPLALSVIANPQRATTVLISPQTTAEALIFMNPNLATTDTAYAEKIMNIIKVQPETKELAKIIESRTQKEPDFLYNDNQQQDQALTKAINAVVNKLADEYQSNLKADPDNRVGGVEIAVTSQNELTANLDLKNYKKRMVDLYFDGDHNGTSYNIYKESLDSANDFIDISNISIGFKPSVKSVGYDIQRPMNKVEVIGLGLKDIKDFKSKWDTFTLQDKLKYGTPIAKSVMSDFVSPVISIISGFNVNKVYKVGLFKILSSLPVLEIVNDFRNKEYGKAFKAVLSGTINALLANNGALLRELLKTAGLDLTDAILKRFNAAIGIFNLARYGIEVVRALYAYSTTNIIDGFVVKNTNGKIEFTK